MTTDPTPTTTRPVPTVDVSPALLEPGDRIHPEPGCTETVTGHATPVREDGRLVGWEIPVVDCLLHWPADDKVRTDRRGDQPATLYPHLNRQGRR